MKLDPQSISTVYDFLSSSVCFFYIRQSLDQVVLFLTLLGDIET